MRLRLTCMLTQMPSMSTHMPMGSIGAQKHRGWSGIAIFLVYQSNNIRAGLVKYVAVGIVENLEISHRVRRPEVSGVGEERRERSLRIFSLPGRRRMRRVNRWLRDYICVVVKNLPHRKDPIDIGMVQPEEWIEPRVGDDSEMSIDAPSDSVDRVVKRFNGIIRAVIVTRNPGLVAEVCIIGVIRKNIIQPLLEAWQMRAQRFLYERVV